MYAATNNRSEPLATTAHVGPQVTYTAIPRGARCHEVVWFDSNYQVFKHPVHKTEYRVVLDLATQTRRFYRVSED